MYLRKIYILTLYIFKVATVFDYWLFLKSFKNLHKRISLSWSYFTKSTTTKYYPNNIQIELTNICNLNCVMCPSQSQTRPKGHLTKERFTEILDSYGADLEVISFDLMGEMLIHPEYDWFLKEAKRRGLKTSISTNATFLTKEHSERIINAGVDFFMISIDDVSGGSYKEIRRGAEFTKVLNNTKQFLELNNGKVFTIIQKIHMSVNKSSVWTYIEEMMPLKADIVRLKPFRDLHRERKYLRPEERKNTEKIQCPYLWRVPVISWDGKLIPCAVDFNATVPLGASPSNLAEAWNGEKFQAFRQMHIDGKKEEIPLCKGCSAIEATPLGIAISSAFDGLNFRKVLTLTQTLKILIKEFNS